MGCRGCSEAENLRRALRVAEAAADGALGVLADVQNALTERALDPTPFGAKEQETLEGVAALIKRYVSRETPEVDEHVQEEVAVPATIRPEVKRNHSSEANPEEHRSSADRLGARVQRHGPTVVAEPGGNFMLVSAGPVGSRNRKR